MTTKLLAPSSTPYFIISGRRGSTYTADGNGVIIINNNDIEDMLNLGCVYPPDVIVGLNNLSATTDPVVGSDNTLGYGVGSRWINTTTPRTWICISAGTGAAVWEQQGGPVKTGSNQHAGTFSCNGTTGVAIANTAYLSTADIITISLQTAAGTVGATPHLTTVGVAGTGFTVAGSASDTSVYNYMITNVAS